MTDWHDEIMPPEQGRLLRSLGPLADRLGYYMAGGTAVGLHLGHRRSLDFDWFAERPATQPRDVSAALRDAGMTFDVKNTSDSLVDGHIDEIKTTFIHYPYPLLAPPDRWDDFGCSIASLTDLSCMKLWAVANRGSRKDFIDVYALLRHGASLPEVLQLYRQKFAVRDTMPILYGLAYFEDAEKQPMPEMLIPEDWNGMKSAIQQWTRAAAR